MYYFLNHSYYLLDVLSSSDESANRLKETLSPSWLPRAMMCYAFYVLYKNGEMTPSLWESCKDRAAEQRPPVFEKLQLSHASHTTYFQPVDRGLNEQDVKAETVPAAAGKH